jgi:maleylacetoacetate isomerase/maleylpyruvate isomerase
MKLYDYYRSSASYRVRIALNIKKITYETLSVHLINNGGEQHLPDYLALNPQGLVPTLVDSEQVISQSLAIIEYLDECFPTPALLPVKPADRAQVRSMALLIACDIHPLNNLRVLNRLRQQFDAKDNNIQEWMHHWMKKGFDAFEHKLSQTNPAAGFCFGGEVSLADLCLIPQVYNAIRFQFPLTDYPRIQEIYRHCTGLPAFKSAEPNPEA